MYRSFIKNKATRVNFEFSCVNLPKTVHTEAMQSILSGTADLQLDLEHMHHGLGETGNNVFSQPHLFGGVT